jgi:hypothetical protein
VLKGEPTRQEPSMPRLPPILVLAILLGACTAEVSPARVEVKPPPVKVTIGGGGGGFCPPGQAKKGNC